VPLHLLDEHPLSHGWRGAAREYPASFLLISLANCNRSAPFSVIDCSSEPLV
jgi:hypothetical protein